MINISIDQFVDEHNLEMVAPKVMASAMRVATASGVSLVMSISGEEFLTTLKGKLSPSLNLFAYQCGDARIALVYLGMIGAAVPAYIAKECWESIHG
jgi:hypothetical protein